MRGKTYFILFLSDTPQRCDLTEYVCMSDRRRARKIMYTRV